MLVFPYFSNNCAKYLRRKPGHLSKRALCAAVPPADRAAAYRCAYAFEQPKRLRVVLREGSLRGAGTAAMDSSNERAGREPASPLAAATSGNITVLGAPPLTTIVNLFAAVSLQLPDATCQVLDHKRRCQELRSSWEGANVGITQYEAPLGQVRSRRHWRRC